MNVLGIDVQKTFLDDGALDFHEFLRHVLLAQKEEFLVAIDKVARMISVQGIKFLCRQILNGFLNAIGSGFLPNP